ncbi:MAG: class I SAM-dependent methyltransferase, partial [Halobacteriota archaeon]
MYSSINCVFCGTSTAEQPATESAQVRCDIREFGDETFTVWRCASCGSLHAKEPIDSERYYRHYPVKLQRYDFFFRALLRKRIGILKHAGLKSGNTLLDYGCGSGHFVRYAREHRVRAEGYDPYSEEFGDPSVLGRSYDFVTAQDVLERVDDPHALVDDLKSYAAPRGCIAIGTPNADAIDLHHALDQVGPLHQPYHRHIPSTAELQRMASEGGWRVVEFRKDLPANSRVPFANWAFLLRYSKSAGGYLDALCDPVSSQLNHILAHPSLIFWGLFGSFFSRKNEMVVVACALS